MTGRYGRRSAAAGYRPAVTGRRVVLSVGANLGDRMGTLQGCVDALGGLPDTDVLAISPVYQTAPVGGPPQPDYLNAVVTATTGLGPLELLGAAHGIEAEAGRVRDVRFGPRTLDVDIICYGGEVSDDPVLTLPHPRAYQRAFVLVPWLDIDPEATLPGRGPIRDLLVGLDVSDVRRQPDLTLRLPPAPGR